ncbi:MAG: protein kinase, partial [Myxococcota bacterium]
MTRDGDSEETRDDRIDSEVAARTSGKGAEVIKPPPRLPELAEPTGPTHVVRDLEELIDTQTAVPPALNLRFDPGEDLPTGQLIGRFRIAERLGQGGSGTVYRADVLATARSAEEPGAGAAVGAVAVKVLHPLLATSPRQVERFFQESRAAQRIRHPAIVEFHEVGHLRDGRPYLVMELIAGTGLHDLLRARGRLSPDEALEILEPICQALE